MSFIESPYEGSNPSLTAFTPGWSNGSLDRLKICWSEMTVSVQVRSQVLIFIIMACHYLNMKNSNEFYSKLKNRDSDLILKMAKCILSAYKRGKDQIDIFEITFKNTDQLIFGVGKSQYKEVLNNCINDLAELEEYELCAEIKKIVEGKKRGRKVKESNV